MSAEAWWRAAVGYQVYVRSFADADGDGVGDLPGVVERLDYLAWLGVDVVWLTPFYPSPHHDQGYDVADYCGVDRLFGTLDDLDLLVAKAHGLGLRVIVDIVPNHTSSEHPWFVASRSGRDNPYRDYYIWRDPAPDGGPPNNWVSVFGGGAWAFDDTTGQYYCHLFLAEQPDLNWASPAVADEFDRILAFWLDRGVDGFRIDVAHSLAKDAQLRDNPPAPVPDTAEAGRTSSGWEAFEHRYDVDQPHVLDIFRRWRRVVEPYGALLLGEVYLLDAQEVARYLAGDGLHLSFWFRPLHLGWDVGELFGALVSMAREGGDAVAWVQSSHDRSRAVTRFGGGEVGRARALVFATLFFGLPGVPFLYQGDELGLGDAEIPLELSQDPMAHRDDTFTPSRDGARTPLPWQPGHGLGFTTAQSAWLPFGDRADADTIAEQRNDPNSTLHRYRRLIALRRGTPDLVSEQLQWLDAELPALAYRRGAVVVAANCGDVDTDVALPTGEWRVVFHTDPALDAGTVHDALALPATTACVLLIER